MVVEFKVTVERPRIFIGDVACVPVFANLDSVVEGPENFILAIFEINENPPFKIDPARMVVPVIILDSEKYYICLFSIVYYKIILYNC